MVDQVNNGLQTFVDMNGDPLSGGLVYMYIPNTATFSMTWSDAAGTVQNTNPIVLDQAGRASIWGAGEYRQVVTDQFGNVQWDRVTAAGNQQNVTGVVQGDLNVTGNAIINQNLTVGGGLNITGGETIAGAITADDGLTVNNAPLVANDSATISNGLVVNAPAGNEEAAIFNGDIVVVSGDRPSVSCSNLSDNLTMGMWEANDALNWGITQSNGIPVQSFLQLGGAGPPADVLTSFGHAITIYNGASPCFTMSNTTDSTSYGMWNASGLIQWGTTDTDGNPGTSVMSLNPSNGLLSVGSFVVQSVQASGILAGTVDAGTLNFSAGGGAFNTEVDFNANTVYRGGFNGPAGGSNVDWGSQSNPWNNVWAHGFQTVSTDADSPMLESVLEVVKKVPVKTLPHIGISAEDAAAVEGATGGIGTNYNVLVGALWRALQELNQKFESYVVAHP